MAVKTVEMVRKIRDKHYETIKRLSFADQLEFIKKKRDRYIKNSKDLRAQLQITSAQALKALSVHLPGRHMA
jgi:hypothetical protein